MKIQKRDFEITPDLKGSPSEQVGRIFGWILEAQTCLGQN